MSNGGAGCRVEVGYGFSPEIEFALTEISFFPEDTLLARGVVAF